MTKNNRKRGRGLFYFFVLSVRPSSKHNNILKCCKCTKAVELVSLSEISLEMLHMKVYKIKKQIEESSKKEAAGDMKRVSFTRPNTISSPKAQY